jgi:nicotinamide-nucleotide amidase
MPAPKDADFETLARRLAARLGGSGQRLATAESCTGGWIAKVCTDLPGSSHWFVGGAVAYANDAKIRALGVSEATLRRHGAVSEATVREMATGALDRFMSDLSLAVTGVAGPDGGTVDKPVGTVWFAWARRSAAGIVDVKSAKELFPGDREVVRRFTVQRALERLLEL